MSETLPDTTALLEALDPDAPLAQRHLWLIGTLDWLRGPRAPAAYEECSKLVTKCSEWTPMGGRFAAPAGATGFRLSLVFVGRGGRILVDDVRAVAGPSPEGPAAGFTVGTHKVIPSRQGLFLVELGGRRALLNAGLRLENDKEGASWQAVSPDGVPTHKEKALHYKGRLLNPGDQREIEFEARVEAAEDGTEVFYTFAGDLLRQTDRVTLALTLPRSTSVVGIPEGADKTTVAVTATSGDGDLGIEFADPARVRLRPVDGHTRLLASFKVDPAANPAQFGFKIRESAGRSFDPIQAADQSIKRREFGAALVLLRTHVDRLKDPQQREKAQKLIRDLAQDEKTQWAGLQGRFFQAWISRRPDFIQQARTALDTYERHWGAGEFLAKAKELRAEDEKQLQAVADPADERPRRILERAKKDAEAGRKALAEIVLQYLLERYKQSEVSAEAQELLKTLGM